MHRNHLLKLLKHYQQTHQNELDCIEQFVSFVTSYPDCFERSLPIGHVTGSAWLVNQAKTHVLLTHHKKLNLWIQLGGHTDGNPNVREVALQEAREESGLSGFQVISGSIFDIDIHLIPQWGNEAEHFHYDVRFAIQTTNSESYHVSDESHDLAWIEIQKLHELTQDESLLRMARKHLSCVTFQLR